MNRLHQALPAIAAVVVVIGSSACQQTIISAQTQAPPGMESSIDPATMTLRLSHGLATVLECTSNLESYSGPCLDLDVDVAGDAVDVFDAHLDDDDGQYYRDGNSESAVRVTQAPPRAAIAVTATAVGESVLTLRSTGPEVSLTVQVIEAPNFAVE